MVTKQRVEVSVYQQAKKGNYYCGDSYFYEENENEFICAIADGLGSGEFANESSQIVIDIIESRKDEPVEHLMKQCNRELTGKRGVVLGVLKINFETKQYSFSSIGNIGLMTVSSSFIKKRNIPLSGYLGGFSRNIKVLKEPLSKDLMFIMFSDGVSSKTLSNKYFMNSDVNVITDTFASLLEKSIDDDDITLVVMKYTG